jgi:hypothetical protein
MEPRNTRNDPSAARASSWQVIARSCFHTAPPEKNMCCGQSVEEKERGKCERQ